MWHIPTSKIQNLPSDLDFLNMYFSAGPFVQRMWSQHSLHHHLYSVHCDLQYPHIFPGPCAPGECRRSTFYTSRAFLPYTADEYPAANYTAAFRDYVWEQNLRTNVEAHYTYLSYVFPFVLAQLAPHRSRSVNPECTTPQDAFLTNIMDFEEFVPPIPPPPYYPPEYTCSSETDAQRYHTGIWNVLYIM